MKKLATLFLIVSTLLWANTLKAQHNKTSWVVGSWRVSKLEMLHLEPLVAKYTPEQKKKYEQELKTIAEAASFEFKKDGTYIIKFSGNQEIGKWKLNPYASKLIKEEKLPDGTYQKPEEVGIESLSKNSIVFLNDYTTGEIIRIFLKK